MNPLGPVHEYEVAPVAVPVSVRLLPTIIGLGFASALTPEGNTFTVTTAVVALVVPQVFIADTVYTPLPPEAIANAAGFCDAAVYPAGPLQLNDTAPAADDVSVRFAPSLSGLGAAEAVTDVGATFTVSTLVVAVAVPQLLVAVIVYIPAAPDAAAKAVGF